MLMQTIGQAQERAKLAALLETEDHVVLYGPPGIGKTRHMSDWAMCGAGQRHYLDASHLHEPTLALSALALSLGLNLEGLRYASQLRVVSQELCERQVQQLLLDTEQLDEPLYALAQALRVEHPELKLIFATRALPQWWAGPRATLEVCPLSRDEALALYAQRSGQSQLTVQTQELVARLDGHPLAIELIAQLRPLMSPEQLVARLEHDLSAWDGIDGALIFAIERGWEALEPALRELMCQLSWLPGPMTIERIERSCQWEGGPLWRGAQALLRAGMLCRVEAEGEDGAPALKMLSSVRLFVRKSAAPELMARARARICAQVEARGARLQAALMCLGADAAQRELLDELPSFLEFIKLTTPSEPGYAQACAMLGFMAMTQGLDPELFLQCSASALEDEGLQARAPSLYVLLMLQRATFERPKQSVAQAIAAQRRVVELATGEGLEGLLSLAWRALAHCLTAAFEDAEAQEAHLSAVRAARHAQDELSLVKALQSLGWFYGHTDRHAEAREALKEALMCCEEAQDMHRAAYVRLQLARSLGHEGFLAEAEHHLEVAEQVSHALPSAQPLFLEVKNLLFLRRGDEASALTQLELVIRAHARQGNARAELGWRGLVASIHARHTRWPEAIACLLEGLSLAERMGDAAQQVRQLTLLACCELARAQASAARGYLERAQAIIPAKREGFVLWLGLLIEAWSSQASISSPNAALEDARADAAYGHLVGVLLDVDKMDLASYERALERLEQWLLLNPESQWGRWTVGLLRARFSHELPAPAGPTLDLERGLVFLPHQEAPINLARRGPQLRILTALMQRYEEAPLQMLSIWEAYELGWPGEEAAIEQMEHRVRVVISRLRGLGLREHIQTVPQGYRWCP